MILMYFSIHQIYILYTSASVCHICMSWQDVLVVGSRVHAYIIGMVLILSYISCAKDAISTQLQTVHMH